MDRVKTEVTGVVVFLSLFTRLFSGSLVYLLVDVFGINVCSDSEGLSKWNKPAFNHVRFHNEYIHPYIYSLPEFHFPILIGKSRRSFQKIRSDSSIKENDSIPKICCSLTLQHILIMQSIRPRSIHPAASTEAILSVQL